MFVARTVEDIIRNKRGNTEVIIGLDGEWANPGILDHPDVTTVYFPEALGQRANTNQLCRLSRAKYVMKADAHTAWDEGFDVKLLAAIEGHDDWTIVPLMRNLHAFDWVCIGENPKSGKVYIDPQRDPDIWAGCGHHIYQSPTPEKCPKCGGNMERLLQWIAKESPKSTAFRFDKTLHFQYFNEFKKRPEGKGDITPTLSLQGSCFMLSREKYWELNICDENHGSWGQQGVEVALKTWESGGKVMCVQTTWYAHMFRTQGGDFGFPYPLSGKEVDKARKYSRELFLENKWPLAKKSLNEVLDMFYPVPEWHDNSKPLGTNSSEIEPTAEGLKKEIIFYTDNQLRLKYAHAVQDRLKSLGIPIVSASLKPMPTFGRNIHIPLERGMEAYFNQIIKALEASTADIVYMCEHDVLYHPSHFDFIPPTKDKFYYNQNFWRIRPEVDDLAVHFDANQVSGLVCYREFLLDWYKNKWEKIQKEGFDRSYEPGGRNSDVMVVWRSAYPNIDIRHGKNLTKSKWSVADFRDKSTCQNWQETTLEQIPGWNPQELLKLTSY